MRTTVTLDPDTFAVIDQVRREFHLTLSEAVNRLVRLGADDSGNKHRPFRQKTMHMGVPRVDLSNTAEVLDLLDDASSQS